MNPWQQIPLTDYELHMSNATVGQLAMLNVLTKEKLEKFKPSSFAILGVCGGNGLEHIDNQVTKEIFGIDINQDYLHECQKRYGAMIPNLHLIQCDLNNSILPDFNVDMFWAALFFEYVDWGKTLKQIKKNMTQDAHLVAVFQKNNGISSVSPTGIKSVEKAGEVFSLVDEVAFTKQAASFGLTLQLQTEHFLPNGKSLLCMEYQIKF